MVQGPVVMVDQWWVRMAGIRDEMVREPVVMVDRW
jgi:hypothetical protein